MAWENVIVGYRLREYTAKDIIPADAVYLTTLRRSMTVAYNTYSEMFYVYHIPIYKKKNVKRK